MMHSDTQFHEKAVLVFEGRPQFVIVTADTTTPVIKDAVLELNYWVKRITGVELDVVTVSEWDGKTPYVALGRSALTERNHWDDGEFRQEEARVFIATDRLGLVGNDAAPYKGVTWWGTYYAVLELVQKGFGVRWIWPGPTGEVFTPRQTLEVSVGAWSWAPCLPLVRMLRNSRHSKSLADRAQKLFGYLNLEPDAYRNMLQLEEDQKIWLKRQRMNQCSNTRFGHSFTNWWDLYGEEHPDWFAKPPEGVTQHGGRGVKLNLSNPEVHDKIVSDWYQAWQAAPEDNKILTIGPNDSRGFDTRPETRAWDAPELARFSDKEIYNGSEPVLSDRYVKFWNIIARRVGAIDPNARLTTYAYRNYRTPPLGSERLEENIIIGYVGGEGYYPDEPHITEEWRGWAERGAKLIWRPNLLHAGHGVPYLFSRALYDDFRFLLEHGMQGSDFDSLTGNWAGQGLVYYVLAEQHSRPEAGYEELVKEYYEAFGPAAGAIRAYMEFFEERTSAMPEIMRAQKLSPRETWGGWWIAHIRLVSLFLTPEVLAEGEALLTQAEEAVAEADPVYRERVELIRIGFEHGKLMAEAFSQLRLAEPQVQIDYGRAKKVLQPLWDYRLAVATNPLVPVVRYLVSEEERLGIWTAFRITESDSSGPPVIPERVITRALDQGWVFTVDPGNEGVKKLWFDPAFGSSGWRPIAVQKPWRQALPDVAESNIGWYRLALDIPDHEDTGSRMFLVFGSVDAEVSLWINGQLVYERGYPHQGNYDSWSESFWIEATDTLQDGARNELVLRVESESRNGGITGRVELLIQH
ncbi:MAG: DUF4838 domain-containing protein [Limnochordia bacterium]|jgi:hypothetical protein